MYNRAEFKLFNRINVLVLTKHCITSFGIFCEDTLDHKMSVKYFITLVIFDKLSLCSFLNSISNVFTVSISCLDGILSPPLEICSIQEESSPSVLIKCGYLLQNLFVTYPATYLAASYSSWSNELLESTCGIKLKFLKTIHTIF